jgi:hypothetical protein
MASCPRSCRAQLALDEGGEVMLVVGTSLSLGHATSGQADVPLWGDLGDRVLEFALAESFHGGVHWRMCVPGEPSGPDLGQGEEVSIGPGGGVCLTQPCAASAAGVLELSGNLDAEGARRVLLVPPGSGGSVRMGSTSECHLFWKGMTPESHVELTVCEEEGAFTLHLRCAEGLRIPGGKLETHWSGPFPPRERVEIHLGDPDSAAPPCALCLSPGRHPTIGLGPA